MTPLVNWIEDPPGSRIGFKNTEVSGPVLALALSKVVISVGTVMIDEVVNVASAVKLPDRKNVTSLKASPCSKGGTERLQPRRTQAHGNSYKYPVMPSVLPVQHAGV